MANKIPLSIKKVAISVVIEPFEPVIQKAVELIESKSPGYFSGITKIVIENNGGGEPFHYGKVKSDDPKTIYLAMDAVRSAIGGKPEEQAAFSIAEVLSHEMGHIKSNFQGGEGPAQSEESRVLNLLSESSLDEVLSIASFIEQLDSSGLNKQAGILRSGLRKTLGLKTAALNVHFSMDDVADTMSRLVAHFAEKVNDDSQKKYLQGFMRQLMFLDALGLSEKKKNPGAGLGATISLLKNLLAGFSPADISKVVNRIYSTIGAM